MKTLQQRIVENLKEHHSKYVNPMCAIRGVDDEEIIKGLEVLEQLVRLGIVDKDFVTEQHLPVYRYVNMRPQVMFKLC